MRILFLIPTLERGGAEKQIALLAEGLYRQGHEAIVVAVMHGGWWGEYLQKQGVPVFSLNLFLGASLNHNLIRQFLELARFIRRHRPDIVVSFLYSVAVWASLAARLAGVRTVIVSRRGLMKSGEPIPRWLERISYMVTTHFVANSQAVVQTLRSEGIAADKTSVIYNGVELPVLEPEAGLLQRTQYGIPDKALAVGMVANFWPHKNHMMLVRAASELAKQQSNIIFILAGADTAYRQQVEREIKDRGLSSCFRLIGPITNVADMLPALDIAVLCSEGEGLSNSILEYMSYGLPVVATRVGGNPELVIEGQTGNLVEFNDATGLAKILLTLLENPAQRVKMGNAARQCIEAQYSWTTALKNWNKLFRVLA